MGVGGDCQFLGEPESRKGFNVCTHSAELGSGLGGNREVGSGTAGWNARGRRGVGPGVGSLR